MEMFLFLETTDLFMRFCFLWNKEELEAQHFAHRSRCMYPCYRNSCRLFLITVKKDIKVPSVWTRS
jgi:hypothetical protein